LRADADGEVGTARATLARAERRLGGLAVALGVLALFAFRVLGGDEHRLAVLLIVGLPLLLGGGLLFVAGRMLQRPGRRALTGQFLLLLFALYWVVLVYA
jgi:hypothetical protein